MTNSISKKPFSATSSVFVGVFISIFSGVLFHFIFDGSDLLDKIGMPYLPYVMAFFIGTTIALLCSKVTTVEKSQE